MCGFYGLVWLISVFESGRQEARGQLVAGSGFALPIDRREVAVIRNCRPRDLRHLNCPIPASMPSGLGSSGVPADCEDFAIIRRLAWAACRANADGHRESWRCGCRIRWAAVSNGRSVCSAKRSAGRPRLRLPTWVHSRLTAFQQATGIGLSLSADPADPVEFGQKLHPTCALINRGKEPCEICRETHRHLRSTACGSGHLERVTCHLGLTNFALFLEIPGERRWLVEGGRFLERSPASGRHGQLRTHLRSLGMDAVAIESVYDTLIRGVPIQPERLTSSLALLESVCRQMERDLPQGPSPGPCQSGGGKSPEIHPPSSEGKAAGFPGRPARPSERRSLFTPVQTQDRRDVHRIRASYAHRFGLPDAQKHRAAGDRYCV